MISCVFEEVLNCERYKFNSPELNYAYMLVFLGIEKPSKGDKILIHEDLLDINSKNFVEPYAFEIVHDEDPKRIKELNDKEFIVVKVKGNVYVLKRIYG